MSADIDQLFAQTELIAQATGHGRTFLILSGSLAGQTFTGTLALKSMIDPSSDLGVDPREVWVLEFISPGPVLKPDDRLREPDGAVWAIANLPNPSYITDSYEVVKVEAIDT